MGTCTGSWVTHRKSGKKGQIVNITAGSLAKKNGWKYQVKWEDGLTTWVFRKEIKM